MIDFRCPVCESSHIYYRIKGKKYHCQKCGNDFEKKDLKEIITIQEIEAKKDLADNKKDLGSK